MFINFVFIRFLQMKKHIKFLLIVIGTFIFVNVTSNYIYKRLDLTEEKRYSLTDASIHLLENVTEPVVIKVYLTGDDLPGGFKRLEKAIRESLEDFRNISNRKIDYEFIDVNQIVDSEAKQKQIDELLEMGMQPTNIYDNRGGSKIETLVFPYATVWQNGEERIVLLLKGNQGASAQEKLNQSYENIEYAFTSAIRQLEQKEKKKIGLLTEFTTLEPVQFAGFITSLQKYYDLFILDAQASITFEGLDALIVPKPQRPIDDSTKWKIDHFVASGGKALFFIDGARVDSLNLSGNFAQPFESNLEDLFFHWGVRMNNDLIKDAGNALAIPMVVGNMGNKPNIQPVPFRFFPLINTFGQSPITRNINMVFTRFSSSLSPVESGTKYQLTPLLQTTNYTKIIQTPAMLSYNESREETDFATYNQGTKTISYLIEGDFSSLYRSRLIPTDKRNSLYKVEKATSKVLIAADGDMIVNEIDETTGNPLPLGLDRLIGKPWGNLDFILNTIDYMLEENGVITARNKEIKIRPLDAQKVVKERVYWQCIVFLIPLLVLSIFGVVRYNWMKRVNTK